MKKYISIIKKGLIILLSSKELTLLIILFSTINLAYSQSSDYSICSLSKKKEILFEKGKRFIYQSDGYQLFIDVIDEQNIDEIMYYKNRTTTNFYSDTIYTYFRIDSLGLFAYDQIYEKDVLIIPRNKQTHTFTFEDSWGKVILIENMVETPVCNFVNVYKLVYSHPEIIESNAFIRYFHWDYGFIAAGTNEIEFKSYLIKIEESE